MHDDRTAGLNSRVSISARRNAFRWRDARQHDGTTTPLSSCGLKIAALKPVRESVHWCDATARWRTAAARQERDGSRWRDARRRDGTTAGRNYEGVNPPALTQ